MNAGEKVLVTGAAGFIASHLVRALVDRGVDVVATSRSYADTGRLSDVLSRIRFERVDMCDAVARRGIFERHRVSHVFHLAAAGVRTASQDVGDMLAVNVVATVELARLAHAFDVKKFVYVGSGFEYASDHLPLSESADIQPANFYGATKSAAALILNEMAKEIGLPLIVFRPFSVYGPAEDPTRLIPYVINQAIRGQQMNLTSCTQVRDYLHVTDVVAAMISVLEQNIPAGECYNLGAGVENSMPIRCIVEKILDLTNASSDLARFGALEQSRPEPSYFVADTTKAKITLGWQPTMSLSTGLTQTIASYRHRG